MAAVLVPAVSAAPALTETSLWGWDSTGTSADSPSANAATATGGSGGNGGSGLTGGNGTQANVDAVNDVNNDGAIVTGINGANNP